MKNPLSRTAAPAAANDVLDRPSGRANRDPREIVREETFMRGRVLAALADGPHTIPEIAAALGCPAHEAMTWVMGMRRYGWVREAGTATDGYFRYQAVEREKR